MRVGVGLEQRALKKRNYPAAVQYICQTRAGELQETDFARHRPDRAVVGTVHQLVGDGIIG